MLRIVAVLLLIPLLDVLLLVAVASRIGVVLTVLVVVLTALIGMLLVRAEGRHTFAKIQRKLAAGEPPTDELLDGGLLLIAGALMLTPGLVTDAVGFLLAVPPTRYPIRVAAKKWVVTPYADARSGGFATGRVYTGGFPGGKSGTGDGNGDAYDLDDDAYDVEFDDRDRRP
ncbi:membrane protein FxsA [Halobacteriales archaeon QS_1_68_17]|nr:MAG: membrane protein FxsA [Halobacteriales archaeon QS_1_68_17]